MAEELFTDIFTVRLPKGVGNRIDRLLKGGELRSAFVRAAVEAELQRREADLPDKFQKRRNTGLGRRF